MIYVIYIFALLFLALCAAMLYVYYRERHIGMFLMGVAYGTGGVVAIMLSDWWPLVAGFVVVWMLKLLGLEMAPRPVPRQGREEGENSRDEGGGLKDKG